MNISLTEELEDFVKAEVKSGQYKSNSEVMRDGLRHLLREKMERRLQERLIHSRQQYAEGKTKVADSDFFEDKIQRIKALSVTQ